MTRLLFREDSYLTTCQATVTAVDEDGGIQLDQTVFYATSGGQPGDTGTLTLADGTEFRVVATDTGQTKEDIIHHLGTGERLPAVGSSVTLEIDWDRRFKLMQMHTACHLLSVVCPFPITGAAVAENDSRVDFDMADVGISREDVTAALQALVAANHSISTRWINDAELDANPDLIKSKNVRPPRDTGKIRLVLIGDKGLIDSQPCGGTHVASTGEIGLIHIAKIEKKGRENRRFRIRFGASPDPI